MDVRSAVESAWQDALGLQRVFADEEDFFEIGGHSLLALAVSGSLSEAFDCEVPITLMFSDTRFGDLVAAVERFLDDEGAVVVRV